MYLLESGTCTVRCFFTEQPARISPVGDLDLAAAPILDRVLDLLFSRAPGDVVVDLSGTTFFGVTGLAFLARLHQRLAAHGHRAIIIEATDHVARTLERVGLDRLFLLDPTPHDARAPGSGSQLRPNGLEPSNGSCDERSVISLGQREGLMWSNSVGTAPGLKGRSERRCK